MNVTHSPSSSLRRGPIISAGVLLGTGLGGFLDGITLHQILQWHTGRRDAAPTWSRSSDASP